jgi:uncharacterized membrane protein
VTGRPISDQQRRWLSSELEIWRTTGLIEPAQAERIQGSYELDSTRQERKQSLARFTLQGIAALFIGLALLLVIGYNWNEFPWVAKLAIVFGSVSLTHALALYLRNSTTHQRVAELLFFLGCLFYGAGIWLVAQVFHLDSHYPDGVWWWALGVLPFALCLDTLLLHALLVGLLALWAGMEVLNFAHLSPFGFAPWWPNGALSLPLLAAPGFVWAYRRQSPSAVSLYVGLTAWWIVLQAIAWDLSWQSLYLIGLMGAAFLILAEHHRQGSRMGMPFRMAGTLFVGGALLPASFLSFHEEMHRWHSYRSWAVPAFIQLVLMLLVFAVLMVFVQLFRPPTAGDRANPFARLLELARRQWVPFALVLVFTALSFLDFASEETAVFAAILANIAMIGFAVWLMQVGLRDERGWFFSAGVLYFLLWSIMRYIDLFGDAGGMLGAAGMFLLSGIALFGLTMLWGKRRSLQHAT